MRPDTPTHPPHDANLTSQAPTPRSLRRHTQYLAVVVACAALGVATTACGGDSVDTAAGSQPVESTGDRPTTTAASEPPATPAPTTDPPSTTTERTIETESTSPATQPPAPPTTVDHAWRADAAAWCADPSFVEIAPPSSPDDVRRYVEDFVGLRDDFVAVGQVDVPDELTVGGSDVRGSAEEATGWLDLATAQIASGSIDGPEYSDTANGSIDHVRAIVGQIAAAFDINGVPCGVRADPARATRADLTVQVPTGYHAVTAFDSVWVASRRLPIVTRLDPETGAVQAVVDTGAHGSRMQASDGRLILRTDDAYVAIDPTTNKVVDELQKSTVGPAADRGWATDGALWICDGQRLHRYDSTTLQPMAVTELGIDCGYAIAAPDLVAAFSWENGVTQPERSAVVFVDPATNALLATVDLPVEVNPGVVLDDKVFFPGATGTQAFVIDRATWTVTPVDLGREIGSRGYADYDGTSIYVIVEGRDVLVVDPTTYSVTETIEAFDFDAPFGHTVNGVAVGPSALWVVNGESSTVQRFDRPG